MFSSRYLACSPDVDDGCRPPVGAEVVGDTKVLVVSVALVLVAVVVVPAAVVTVLAPVVVVAPTAVLVLVLPAVVPVPAVVVVCLAVVVVGLAVVVVTFSVVVVGSAWQWPGVGSAHVAPGVATAGPAFSQQASPTATAPTNTRAATRRGDIESPFRLSSCFSFTLSPLSPPGRGWQKLIPMCPTYHEHNEFVNQ